MTTSSAGDLPDRDIVFSRMKHSSAGFFDLRVMYANGEVINRPVNKCRTNRRQSGPSRDRGNYLKTDFAESAWIRRKAIDIFSKYKNKKLQVVNFNVFLDIN